MRPVTPDQWQDAVDAAQLMTMLEIARLYEITSGFPEINIERCEELLADGRALGIYPREVSHCQFCAPLRHNIEVHRAQKG